MLRFGECQRHLAGPPTTLPAMSLTRRQFALGLGSAALYSLLVQPTFSRAAEARVIGWPSRVVQLPPTAEDGDPPVVTAVRLHKDGQWLATAGDDHLVHLWKLSDGALFHKLDAHTDWVRT